MGWRPWRALREREDVCFELADFPPGPVRALLVESAEQRLILVDRSLPPTERLAALAHELVHLERGGSGHHPHAPRCWSAVVAREEHRVDAIVAERLVPPAKLRPWVASRAEVEPVTAALVADEWDVPEHVAERALGALRRKSA